MSPGAGGSSQRLLTMTTGAWGGVLLVVGSSRVDAIPIAGRWSGADDPVRSWPLGPAHRRTLVLDEHRPSMAQSRDNVPQFLS